MTFTEIHPWLGKVGLAVGIAAILGAGNTIITNKVDIVEIRGQVQEVSDLKEDLRSTRDELRDIAQSLAILVDREDRRTR